MTEFCELKNKEALAILDDLTIEYIEIILNYEELQQVGNHKDLSVWLNLLSRFNNGTPLDKQLIKQIEDFFDYYWVMDRNSCIKNEGARFIVELPEEVQNQIYIEYLFADFLYKYKHYFYPKSK